MLPLVRKPKGSILPYWDDIIHFELENLVVSFLRSNEIMSFLYAFKDFFWKSCPIYKLFKHPMEKIVIILYNSIEKAMITFQNFLSL